MEQKEISNSREVAIIDTVAEFSTDETPDGDTEITLIQFNDDEVLANEGEESSSGRTLLGRLRDGRIIISSDHVTTVAMVDEIEEEEVEPTAGLKRASGHRRREGNEKQEIHFPSSTTATTTTFITESGETIEVLTTADDVEPDKTQADDGADAFEQSDDYVIQMPQNFRFGLLKSLSDVSESYFDLPIFCRDGLAFSNKFVLAAASALIKDALMDAESNCTESCLVIPDVCKSDFEVFHSALFAQEKDDSIDAFVVIRTAEILGVDFPLTTSDDDSTHLPMPTVDYSMAMGNVLQRQRLHKVIGSGFNPMCGPELGPSRCKDGFHSTSEAVKKLVSVLDTNSHPCKVCKRFFVDETSLNKHFATLHASKMLSNVTRNGNTYECKMCPRSFSFTINLKKHVWLAHTKSQKTKAKILENSNEKTVKATSNMTGKKVKLQEKYDDMICKACGFVAQNWKQLDIHIMDHTMERPFKCDVCPKGFKELQKLNRHKLVHSGVRPYQCKFCGKYFSLLHNMRSHEKIHVGKGHTCEYCGKVYSQVTTFRRHKDKHKKKGHAPTSDAGKKLRQRLNMTGRGRPSLAETFSRKEPFLGQSGSKTEADIKMETEFEAYDSPKGLGLVQGSSNIIEQCLEVAKIDNSESIFE